MEVEGSRRKERTIGVKQGLLTWIPFKILAAHQLNSQEMHSADRQWYTNETSTMQNNYRPIQITTHRVLGSQLLAEWCNHQAVWYHVKFNSKIETQHMIHHIHIHCYKWWHLQLVASFFPHFCLCLLGKLLLLVHCHCSLWCAWQLILWYWQWHSCLTFPVEKVVPALPQRGSGVVYSITYTGSVR